ncbi:Uncharacterised protein [Yersinia mollaretii]|nr:Uncharacterised protein [Yersinia mollaretii]CQQ62001.1 Uncharacterised protein [Yersinia mollaretii]
MRPPKLDVLAQPPPINVFYVGDLQRLSRRYEIMWRRLNDNMLVLGVAVLGLPGTGIMFNPPSILDLDDYSKQLE